jgi:hypothetical protein
MSIRAVALMTTVLIIGAIFLAIGISNVVDASEIASHGVQVRAVVLGVPKDGPSNSTEVSHTTASGQREQGVLGGVSYLPGGVCDYRGLRPSAPVGGGPAGCEFQRGVAAGRCGQRVLADLLLPRVVAGASREGTVIGACCQ